MAELTVFHRYPFPAEKVFDAWLDPAIARRFLFATPEGEMVRAEVDARVGGRFTFVDRRPGVGEVAHVGEYLEIDRPRRLVFTFAVPQFDPNDTTVTVTIAPDGDGCVATLTHDGVLEEWAERSTEGWRMILAGLERALA
ncbi:SRPBCC domain-containing protein [Phenylobacterium sp.]|uniref:SRPBCC family protein n=1 Tax=Phenylobacterium sp. TaxID=1871053 RepID=UPI0025EA29ED|nr:SRPBCC domain-containing protein [Phenylobacterium sp.]